MIQFDTEGMDKELTPWFATPSQTFAEARIRDISQQSNEALKDGRASFIFAEAIRRAANEAIAVQNASNLSGVVRSFHEVLSNTLWPSARAKGYGTQWVNTHPITRLFIAKLADLSGYQSDDSLITLADMERY